MRKTAVINKENSKHVFDLFISSSISAKYAKLKIASRLDVDPIDLILSYRNSDGLFVSLA